MNVKTLSAWCAAAWFAVAATPAMAEAPAPDPEARFAEVDTDGDGMLSPDEFAAARERRLAEIKRRLGDRYDPERAANRPTSEDVFATLDTNADGFLSPEELAQGRRRMRPRRPPWG